jgi:curved DNA-binding protein CbpA
MSLYDDLGVGSDATFDEIRSAYRKRARACHPDLGGDREEFERIQNAHDVLSDTERRARYDQTGETATNPDNRLSEISAAIVAAFDHVLAQAGAKFREHDLIVHTCSVLRSRKRALRKSLANATDETIRLGEVIERLSFEGAGPDILRSTLRQRIVHHESAIRTAEHNLEVIDEAIAYLRSYGFAWRRPELGAAAAEPIDYDAITFEGMDPNT